MQELPELTDKQGHVLLQIVEREGATRFDLEIEEMAFELEVQELIRSGLIEEDEGGVLRLTELGRAALALRTLEKLTPS
jgi:hypothetical protein